MAGEHLTKPPYGYKVAPNNKKQWVVDKEAAHVVKRIYEDDINGTISHERFLIGFLEIFVTVQIKSFLFIYNN